MYLYLTLKFYQGKALTVTAACIVSLLSALHTLLCEMGGGGIKIRRLSLLEMGGACRDDLAGLGEGGVKNGSYIDEITNVSSQSNM